VIVAVSCVRVFLVSRDSKTCYFFVCCGLLFILILYFPLTRFGAAVVSHPFSVVLHLNSGKHVSKRLWWWSYGNCSNTNAKSLCWYQLPWRSVYSFSLCSQIPYRFSFLRSSFRLIFVSITKRFLGTTGTASFSLTFSIFGVSFRNFSKGPRS
jgi:hypothetical protein